MRAIVFAGPSLPSNAAPSIHGLEWLPPVRQGDVYRAALSRPDIIAIIDGYFEVTPTVWHKEILWAMAHGIHVYGGASVGALRAAELDVFGMQGVGHIYEMYRDGVLQDDDEVAVLHGPEELGYPNLTVPMVNIRATVEECLRLGVLGSADAAELQRVAKSLFYKERTYDAIIAASVGRLPASTIREFEKRIAVVQIDQKRRDGLTLLNAIREHLSAGTAPLKVQYSFANTAAWQDVLQRTGAVRA